jgi:hypothetical protein
VTLATSDSYALGALVLSSSLKRVNATRQLVVMVTTGVTQQMRSVCFAFFCCCMQRFTLMFAVSCAAAR